MICGQSALLISRASLEPAAYSKIVCPTLIVWGAHDTLVPVKDAKRMQELILGARREVFERTGHVAMLERPERFNRVLREFLDEEPGQRHGAALARDRAL